MKKVQFILVLLLTTALLFAYVDTTITTEENMGETSKLYIFVDDLLDKI